MFTGLITGLGHILSVEDLGDSAQYGKQVRLQAPPGYLEDVSLGDSIAINGACMTAAEVDLAQQQFSIVISAESLNKTTGLDRVGPVNLEKALRAHERLGGHIVSGHVDGIGQISALHPVGESYLLEIQAPKTLAPYLAHKGSVAVHGVSLTVNAVQDFEQYTQIQINLIPHTMAHTNLGQLKAGDAVNLEIDLIARYCERMLSYSQTLRR